MVSRCNVLPPFFDSQSTTVNVCCVNQMTVDQTGNWIRTLGLYKRWKEAEAYAATFREQAITGKLLEDLTHEMLEGPLGVKNPTHRQELMHTIQCLFSNLLVENYNVAAEQGVTGLEILGSLCGSPSAEWSYPLSTYSYEPDYCGNPHLVPALPTDIDNSAQMAHIDLMSDSGSSKASTNEHCAGNYSHAEDDRLSMSTTSVHNPQSEIILDKSEDVPMSGQTVQPVEETSAMDSLRTEVSPARHSESVRETSLDRYRKLHLILRRDQMCDSVEDQIKTIRSRFARENFDVEVHPMENKPILYSVVFPNRTKANEACALSNVIGYKLLKKRPPRPSPRYSVKFKSVKSLWIRSGKALSGRIVGSLEKDRVVSVNQIKGRRARVVEEKENGEVVTCGGWVSLHTVQGRPLLVRIGDI